MIEISHPVCEIRGDETDWAQEGAHVGAGGVLLHRVGWGAPHPAPSSLQQASCSHLCPHLSNPTAFELLSSCHGNLNRVPFSAPGRTASRGSMKFRLTVLLTKGLLDTTDPETLRAG